MTHAQRRVALRDTPRRHLSAGVEQSYLKKGATQSPRSTDSPARSQLVQALAMGCEAGGEVLGETGGAADAEGWDLLSRLGTGPVVNVFRPL